MSLFFKTIIKRKKVTQEFIKGVPALVSSDATVFNGNIQPYKGNGVNDQTEGLITSGLITVFSEDKLVIPSAAAATKGTYVLYHGIWYECIKELDWGDQTGFFADLSYYKYIAVWREADA